MKCEKKPTSLRNIASERGLPWSTGFLIKSLTLIHISS